MRKKASFRDYTYSRAGNTRESKIKTCSKNHLGFLKHEASNMAAVSPCQVQAIELQLVAWQEAVRRQRTSLLAWLVVYSLYITSITCWLFGGFSFSVCHLMAVALLRLSLLYLSFLIFCFRSLVYLFILPYPCKHNPYFLTPVFDFLSFP